MFRKIAMLLIAAFLLPKLTMAKATRVNMRLSDCAELHLTGGFEVEELSYVQTDLPQYDKFFRDIVCVQLGVRAINAGLDYFSSEIQSMTGTSTKEDALAALSSLKQEGKLLEIMDKLLELTASLEQSYKATKMLIKKVPNLVKQGQRLIQSAKSTFIGPKARKLPKVVKALKQSITNLKALPKDLSSLLKALEMALNALKEITT